MANLNFKTDLTSAKATPRINVTNEEVNTAEFASYAAKALAMVADGFGIENMFYKTEETNRFGEKYWKFRAHSSKTDELEALLKGE